MAQISGSLVRRKYSNFKGMDTREGVISLDRSPDALNMYRNYKSSNMLETRPDIELLTQFDSSVYGLFFYEVGLTKQLIVHSGTKLYKVVNGDVSKNDSIKEVHLKLEDIETSITSTDFEWRYESGSPTNRAIQWQVVFGTDAQSKKYIVMVKDEFDTTVTPHISKYYLYGYWRNTTGNKYEFVSNTDDIPGYAKSSSDMSCYGEDYINFEYTLTAQTPPAATLPSVMTAYTKTQLTFTGFGGMNPAKSYFFVYNNILYIKDGINYLQYDGTTLSNVVGYIPTTSISRTAAGGGVVYEDVNMLSPYRKNTFVADGTSTDYHLDAQNIDGVVAVKVNGVVQVITTDYTIDTTNGIISFTTAPTEPDTDGQDNVEITYTKNVSGYADRILHCKLLCVFDNRVFFSGNPDYPNVVWHSSLDDPSYVSDLDYYNEGLDLARVKALVPGNNALWVFKEPSQANTTVFYHIPTIDAQYGKIYPSSHSGISTGCIASGINFNDDICFFSARGLEGVSGDVTTEQVVAHRSTFIDNKLLKEDNYSNMILEEWDGYLLVFIDNKVYLADSRQATALNGALEYDWYYWELSKNVKSTFVKDNILYVGCEDGLYSFTKEGNVECYWTTPMDTFGYGNYQKITNKRGCIIECEGNSIDVSVKTNKDTMTLIKNFTNVIDYIVARIKRKKFKDMQIKVSSDEKMKLESIMIESYVGAYVKR